MMAILGRAAYKGIRWFIRNPSDIGTIAGIEPGPLWSGTKHFTNWPRRPPVFDKKCICYNHFLGDFFNDLGEMHFSKNSVDDFKVMSFSRSRWWNSTLKKHEYRMESRHHSTGFSYCFEFNISVTKSEIIILKKKHFSDLEKQVKPFLPWWPSQITYVYSKFEQNSSKPIWEKVATDSKLVPSDLEK